MPNPLNAFSAQHQASIRTMLDVPGVQQIVNAALMLAHPGTTPKSLDAPIPDRTCQTIIIAAWLALRDPHGTAALEQLLAEQDAAWQAACAANRAHADAEAAHQRYEAQASRAAATAALLAKISGASKS